jgi:predicted O-linked N-acetylglucosamine transferase (SPINDLY family)
MSTTTEALAKAKALHRAGQLQAAEQGYLDVLRDDPASGETLYLLGALYHAQGSLGKAVECLQRSVQVRPGHPEGFNHLGVALIQSGRVTEAVRCFREALRLRPDFADARDNLAKALPAAAAAAAEHNRHGAEAGRRGDVQEAVVCFLRAIRLQPGHADARRNLAVALAAPGKSGEAIAGLERAAREDPGFAEPYLLMGEMWLNVGKPAEAEGLLRRAVSLDPRNAQAQARLGDALRLLGRLPEAAACLSNAAGLEPGEAEYHCLLGLVLKGLGRLDEAVACYDRALRLRPDYPDAISNRGNVFLESGRLDEAVAAYRRAVAVAPEFAAGHCNLGIALTRSGQPDEALACFERAVGIDPGQAAFYNHMGNCLKDKGRLDESFRCFRRAVELEPGFARAYSNLLFALPFSPDYDTRAVYEENVLWARRYAEPLTAAARPHTNDRSPDRRLRVGYVSPNFMAHCQAYFMTPLLAAHDHRDFAIVCYSDVLRPDAITARLRSYADEWRDVAGLTHEGLAEAVRRDNIDVLVDLTMHMGRDRLLTFARKPAPVQVCWLAYPGTTGLSAIDYRLTDPYLDPPGPDDAYHSEEPVRLPDCFWCYDPLADGPPVNPLPALERGYVTFASLNNFCKINDGVLTVWARVLGLVEGSRLLLLAPEGSHRGHVFEVLGCHGVSSERVTFTPHRPRGDYLRLYQGVDLGLDTFPSNGHTTSLDSYWMGVPVVTLAGSTAVGRAGVCQLMNLGLPELIARTPDEFVEIAAGLARDLPRLGKIRATLRDRTERSPLMDAPRFARNIEAAYRAMWRRWCAGEAPKRPAVGVPGR